MNKECLDTLNIDGKLFIKQGPVYWLFIIFSFLNQRSRSKYEWDLVTKKTE